MLVTDEMNDFHKKADVVSCFVEYNNKHLLLQRQLGKTSANQWVTIGPKPTTLSERPFQ